MLLGPSSPDLSSFLKITLLRYDWPVKSCVQTLVLSNSSGWNSTLKMANRFYIQNSILAIMRGRGFGLFKSTTHQASSPHPNPAPFGRHFSPCSRARWQPADETSVSWHWEPLPNPRLVTSVVRKRWIILTALW